MKTQMSKFYFQRVLWCWLHRSDTFALKYKVALKLTMFLLVDCAHII